MPLCHSRRARAARAKPSTTGPVVTAGVGIRLGPRPRLVQVPGTAFGPTSGANVRISLATAPDLLLEGVERLAGACSDWS